MLDFDLAEMYGIENRVLKQAVRRNLKRFEGEDFMFELTRDELSRSQIVTLNKGRGSNFKYMPFAFTELGVAMLSSVLNSDTDWNKQGYNACFRCGSSVTVKPADRSSI